LRYVRIGLVLLAALVMPLSSHAQEPAALDVSPERVPSNTFQPETSPAGSESPELPEAPAANQPPPDEYPDQESHQRLLGVIPQFAIVNDPSKARPLTVREKWRLYYRQTLDPYHFVDTGIAAGISQARDTFPEYGQGMEGYGKRYGARFADGSLGGFFGRFLLPSLLHDDPRYFRKGSGSVFRRGIYAATRVLITRHDDGSNRPNYSGVSGAFIGTAFGNIYYPDSERGVGITFVRGAWIIQGAAVQNVFDEFWPDIHDKIFKKKEKKEKVVEEKDSP